MKIDKCLYVIALLIAVSAPAAAQIRWEPYRLDVRDRGAQPAELGRLTVPARHGAANTPTIEIAVVRLKSTLPASSAPLVYLDGGPGGSGFGIAREPDYYRLFDAIRQTRDVILLSQRGTGLASPRLVCGSEGALPDDLFRSAQSMAAALEPRARACAAQWKAKGVDLGAFNTQESADDVEDLRRALGVPKLTLLGFSYGTHLGLSILRRHPASIERAVFAGVEAPDATWKLPSVYDAQLATLAKAAGVDLVATWKNLLASAEQQPLQVKTQVDGKDRTLVIGREGLQYLLRRDIGDTNDWPVIPAAIAQAARGDLSLVGRLAARRVTQLGSGMALMPFAMDCASGASADRLARITQEEPGSTLGRMTNFPYPMVCASLDLPMLPDAFRAPVRSDIPTLFITGTYDSNTPLAQAASVARGFANATELLVDNAGHESTLPAEVVQKAIVAFLLGHEVGTRTSIPAPQFRPAQF